MTYFEELRRGTRYLKILMGGCKNVLYYSTSNMHVNIMTWMCNFGWLENVSHVQGWAGKLLHIRGRAVNIFIIPSRNISTPPLACYCRQFLKSYFLYGFWSRMTPCSVAVHFQCVCTTYSNYKQNLYSIVNNYNFLNISNYEKFVFRLKFKWKYVCIYLEKALDKRKEILYKWKSYC